MQATLPPKSSIVLWKVTGRWAFNLVYPPGATVPTDAKPFDIKNGDDLAEVHTELLKHMTDERLPGGHPPAFVEGELVDALEDGTMIIIKKSSDAWISTTFYRTGGMSQRTAPYSSVADAFEGIRLLHGEM